MILGGRILLLFSVHWKNENVTESMHKLARERERKRGVLHPLTYDVRSDKRLAARVGNVFLTHSCDQPGPFTERVFIERKLL